MSQGQTDLAQLDFSAGMTRDAAPHQIDPRAVWDHVNGLYDEDGSAYKRGGTVALTDTAYDESGRFILDVIFDAGQRTIIGSSEGFGVLNADDDAVIDLGAATGPSASPSWAFTNGMLFIGGGFVYAGSRKAADYSAGTIAVTLGDATVTGTGTAFLANVDPGMMIQISTGRLYVVASVTDNTHLELVEPYGGTNDTGLAYTARRFWTISGNSYRAADHYAVVANRLVRGIGNLIQVAEVNAPHDWTATIVGGSPSQVPTEHELPDGVVIRGLSVIGQTLLIHTSGGTWTLDGLQYNIVDSYGTPQHRLAVLSRDMILWGQGGIEQWQQAVILPCMDGIYMVDGISSPRPVSNPIDELYRDYVRRGYRPGGAAVYNGHYLLPVLSASGDSMIDLLVCRLDRVIEEQEGTHPWSRFAGRGGRLGALAVRIPQTPDEPKLLAVEHDESALVVDASGFFAPDVLDATDVEEPIEWSIVSRDFETGNLTENMVRHLRSRYEMVGEGASIDFAYGFGFREQTGYDWDLWDWAEDAPVEHERDLFWAGEDEDVFTLLNHPGGPSLGDDTHRCPVNTRCRYIRFRLSSDSPVSALRLRSIEPLIRPSRAVRR